MCLVPRGDLKGDQEPRRYPSREIYPQVFRPIGPHFFSLPPRIIPRVGRSFASVNPRIVLSTTGSLIRRANSTLILIEEIRINDAVV
jgi:hypothetical protein